MALSVSLSVCVSITSMIAGRILSKIKKNVKNDFHRFSHLPSKCSITIVVVRDIYLLFQSRLFKMFNISSQIRDSAKMCDTVFLCFNICHRIAPLRKLFSIIKLQIITMLFSQICFHMYGTRRRVALVVLAFTTYEILTFKICDLEN